MAAMFFRVSVLSLLSLLILTGCFESSRYEVALETDEKGYQRAQHMMREGRKDDALTAFIKVIEKRVDAPQSHFEAGMLYDNHIGDPVFAIYHYRKYLELNPEGREAPQVKQLVQNAKKKLARQLPGQPMGDQIDRLDLLELLSEVRNENTALKQRLATLQARGVRQSTTSSRDQVASTQSQNQSFTRLESPNLLSGTRATPPVAQQQPSREENITLRPPPAETYTVQSGDSLYKISKKVYGTSSRYLDIYQANRDQMSSPSAVRVGQVLRIP